MTKLNLEQKKERLKRELAKIETEQKKLKKQNEMRNQKLIIGEILKHSKSEFDDFNKILGLLTLFDNQNDEFRKAVFVNAEREIEKRKIKN